MKLLFQSLSNWGNILLLFSLFLLFNALLGSFLSKEHALDLMFAYSAEDAYAAPGQLSAEQLSAYEFGI
ncbi:hypothetical protein J0A68_19660 [Algoriphagus sp. H41]|uniref:ABC transporter permease n=1 Tax=Algoriphagus oliviformis TaxID=2811231 RepID=A0ABS3C880_9BACT|nr:hypothetical protein [Algoriphagus oliviformis]MBN7813182.1 hypothetical protein [Algoriphagus oliviformis]